ncbi:hypothetical protein HNQ56_001404 [Anaerotaenia torta]|uniref:hypothetical protein n=1 Tax=Anaerotaenia torta TaxID=433293 RepID=UPI003D1B0C7D
MSGRGSIRINIGGTSIIVILLVILLTIFGVLSVRTSYHELKLSEKTAARAEEYYLADSKAEELLMVLNELLVHLQWNGSPEQWEKLETMASELEGVTQVQQQEGLVTYEVAMNNASSLKVEVSPGMKDSGPYLSIISWKMVTKEQGEYDSEGIEIWDGTFDE